MRFTISKPNWLLIVGPDLNNNDWGVTFNHGPIQPLGDWKRWRRNFRLNFRWPLQFKFKAK